MNVSLDEWSSANKRKSDRNPPNSGQRWAAFQETKCKIIDEPII